MNLENIRVLSGLVLGGTQKDCHSEGVSGVHAAAWQHQWGGSRGAGSEEAERASPLPTGESSAGPGHTPHVDCRGLQGSGLPSPPALRDAGEGPQPPSQLPLHPPSPSSLVC